MQFTVPAEQVPFVTSQEEQGRPMPAAVLAPRASPREMPVVAIVGRPNVGKSTLFNRILKQRLAIVSEIPGTTRDRIMAPVSWEGKTFLLVDTGGIQTAPESDLWAQVRGQVQVALEEAQVVIFLVDARDGLTPADSEVAELLRRTAKPVVLGVNKADNRKWEQVASEFYRLGLGDPVVMSAYHNHGVEDLLDLVARRLPPVPPVVDPEEGVLRLAILGRPNVGKSSFLNAALGEERAIVSPIPGTTRDALDTPGEYQGHPLVLIDTAGIRRRGHVQPGIEQYSVLRAVQALARCDVALLIVEAVEPMTDQDLHIAGLALEAYRGVVVVVNKWDLAQAEGVDRAEVEGLVRERLHFAPYVPVCFASALRGEGISEALDEALQVYQQRLVRVPHDQLQRKLMEAVGQHAPPSVGKRSLNIYRVEQIGVNPPAFVFAVNHPDLLHFSYHRYLENTFRKAFGFRGSRLNLIFRRRGESA